MLTLIKLNPSEFEEFKTFSISSYRDEKMRAESLSPEMPKIPETPKIKEETYRIAAEQFQSLLLKGLDTPEQFLFKLVDHSHKRVGYLWFCTRERAGLKSAFLYDIFIEPEWRMKGYGKKAMHLFEQEVRRLGINRIGLHVFGHNDVALQMYEKLGYRTTSRMMAKDLS